MGFNIINFVSVDPVFLVDSPHEFHLLFPRRGGHRGHRVAILIDACHNCGIDFIVVSDCLKHLP